MEGMPGDAAQMEPGSSNTDWLPLAFMENLYSMSLNSQEDTVNFRESNCNVENNEFTFQKASQILWATGSFSGLIPNGFYSVIPDKKIKEIFYNIPSLDEISSFGFEGSRADIILVDGEKDKKLSLLKQLIVTLVKGSNSNPPLVIKKIAGLVFEVYGCPNSEPCSGKARLEEIVTISDTPGIPLLGQIKNASCRPQAILFKVLADAGLPTGVIECMDSCSHMSVVVVLKSNELLVDLVRFPGQLARLSAKAVLRSHVAAAVDSDSAENDSCDPPLEPNSPMWSFSDRQSCNGNCSSEPDEFYLQSHYQWKPEASLNASGSFKKIALQPSASVDGKPRARQKPYVANAVRQCNWRKSIAEQWAALSSPEHPLLRTHGQSMLYSPGEGQSFREYKDDIAVSRSVGASTSGNRRTRQCSISIAAEIGNDIVSAAHATNETLKQHCLSKEDGENNVRKYIDPSRNVSNFHLYACGEISGGRYATTDLLMKQISSNQKARSLPSSPIEFGDQANGRTITLVSTWNKVLQSSTFLNKHLLPLQEWNIDFSGLTIGTRVGIVWNGTDVAVKIFLEQELTAGNMENFCNDIFILRGIMRMHRLKIAHRDLKSANCLVNKHWIVKICDFGLSRVMTEVPMRDCSSAGTPEWMAPELIRKEPFTEKCDIFSFGVIMWELCMLSRPWEGVPSVQVVHAVANEGSRLEIPEGPMGKLISDCWAEPEERPSCEEILCGLLDCEYTLS